VKSRILLVEDEPGLAMTLADLLSAEGYLVEAVRDGLSGLAKAGSEPFDLLILDVMLPGKNGLEVCRELRQQGNDVAILMLTAKTQLVDRVVGLKLGPDDYVTKPFGMAELMARIRTALRHRLHQEGAAPVFRSGDLMVDLVRRLVTVGGQPVHLSPREYDILALLVKHAGKVLTHRHILGQLWGASGDVQQLRVYVRQVRQKIEADPEQPRHILTETGVGYRLAVQE